MRYNGYAYLYKPPSFVLLPTKSSLCTLTETRHDSRPSSIDDVFHSPRLNPTIALCEDCPHATFSPSLSCLLSNPLETTSFGRAHRRSRPPTDFYFTWPPAVDRKADYGGWWCAVAAKSLDFLKRGVSWSNDLRPGCQSSRLSNTALSCW
jgi:hypothetical protein